MSKFWILVIKFVSFIFYLVWSSAWILIILFKALIKLCIDYTKKNNLFTSHDMEDPKETAVHQNPLVIENNINNDTVYIFSTCENTSSDICVQQADEQLFFDYFRENYDNFVQPATRKLNGVLNNSENDRHCLWNTMEELGVGKNTDQTYFIDNLKPSGDQPHILNSKETGEYAIPYTQSENIKFNEVDNKNKRALLYFDDFHNVSDIKWIKCADISEVKLISSDDAKLKTVDVLSEKKLGLKDKAILMKSDNKLNLAPTISDLEHGCIASSAEDDCLSFLQIKSHEADINDEKRVKKINKQEVNLNHTSKVNVFTENNTKSIDVSSCHNQKFVKDEIKVSENEFLSNLYIENYAITERPEEKSCRQRNDGKCNKQNTKSQLLSIESNTKMETKNIVSCTVSTKYPETTPSKLENEPGGDTAHIILKEFSCSNDNLEKNRQLIHGETYQTNCFHETKRSESIDLISWEMPDEKFEFQLNQTENERHLPEEVNVNIVKRDERYAGNDKQDKVEFEYENKNETNLNSLMDCTKLLQKLNIHSHCEDLPLNEPNSNSPTIKNNYSNEGSKSGSTCTANHKVGRRNMQKHEGLCRAEKLLDSQLSTNKLTEIPEKSVSDSSDEEKGMLSRDLNEDASERLNTLQKDFLNEKISKPPRSKTVRVRDSSSDKVPSKHFLKAVSSQKMEDEKLENECNSSHKLHDHYTVMFGQCTECVPIQSKKTVKEATRRRILSKSSPPYVFDRDKRLSSKSRNAGRKRTEQVEESVKTNRKKVTFAKEIRIFSFNPNDSVLATFHNYTTTEEEEQTVKKLKDVVSVSVKGGDANKRLEETDPKMEVPETRTKSDEKSTNIGDTSTETVKAPSDDAKVTATATKEPLAEVTETFYYDNMGYIPDCIASCSFETDMMDSIDTSVASEEDCTLFSEKKPLIDTRVKTFPRKISDLTRYTECKAAKWFRKNSRSFKRFSFKNIKST